MQCFDDFQLFDILYFVYFGCWKRTIELIPTQSESLDQMLVDHNYTAQHN